jgi:hypothetical protein
MRVISSSPIPPPPPPPSFFFAGGEEFGGLRLGVSSRARHISGVYKKKKDGRKEKEAREPFAVPALLLKYLSKKKKKKKKKKPHILCVHPLHSQRTRVLSISLCPFDLLPLSLPIETTRGSIRRRRRSGRQSINIYN